MAAVSLCLTSPFLCAASDLNPWGVYTWAGWQPGEVTRETHPHVKGVPIILKWDQLEPAPGNYQFDKLVRRPLEAALKEDFFVFMMLWVVPATPSWLYDNGVPKVDALGRINPFRNEVKWDYPYYLDEDYQNYFFRVIRAWGDFVRELPMELRERIVFIQSAEGSTGDGQPYKTQPTDPQYRISFEAWSDFRIKVWSVYKEAFINHSDLPVPLLVNNDANREKELEWLFDNLNPIGAKQGMFSHGYHISGTQERLADWQLFVKRAEARGKQVFTRGEQDGEWNIVGWSKQNPEQAFYWACLFALHCGLDLWNVPAEAAAGERLAETLEFFNKYAFQRDPATASSAFCALRKGLDAADSTAYPESDYGPARKDNVDRYLKIAAAFASHGAMQGDPDKATGAGMKNRQRDDYNDVGWRILPGNYCRFLKQLNPDETSTGYWHVDPDKHPYSRFARALDPAGQQNEMLFDLASRFFQNQPDSAAFTARITYLDKGQGSWTLDVWGKHGLMTQTAIELGDTGKWMTVLFDVEGADMTGPGPEGADLRIRRVSGNDLLFFHLIEINRKTDKL
ncbi:MAG: hypothetical protein KJT03_05910 [Verrucomicrobiae bacterium]|nr:hypothetical protein [Verrucomicrobiae bacterium]